MKTEEADRRLEGILKGWDAIIRRYEEGLDLKIAATFARAQREKVLREYRLREVVFGLCIRLGLGCIPEEVKKVVDDLSNVPSPMDLLEVLRSDEEVARALHMDIDILKEIRGRVH